MTQPSPQTAQQQRGYASATAAAQAAAASAFYAAQALLAAWAIADILVLWQQLDLRNIRSSWPALRAGLSTLIEARFGMSASQAATYYEQAREAAGIPGSFPVPAVPAPSQALITATLDSTGPYALLGRLKAGQPLTKAVQTTGVVMSGAASRLVQNGARQVVLAAVAADPEAVAWMRVTAANPCAFCAMLASRGAVYKSETSAGFKAHNHCRCVAAPVWSQQDADLLRDNDLYQQWKQVTKGLAKQDALNAWRRYWDQTMNRDGMRILPAA